MIIVLMGKSASGKDTVYRELLRDELLGLQKIVLYTTRPMRDGEKQDREYHFVTEAHIAQMEAEGRIIEKRMYSTVHGDWTYATAADDVYADPASDFLVIGTLESYVSMCRYYGDDVHLMPLYIEVPDDGERLERALRRERMLENPRYKEMCRRFLADEEDFAPERLREAGVEKIYSNEDLQQCLATVKADILADKHRRADIYD